MMLRTLALLLAVALCLTAPATGRAQNAERAAPAADLSGAELDRLIGLIENPEQRAAFLRDLRTLAEARAAAGATAADAGGDGAANDGGDARAAGAGAGETATAAAAGPAPQEQAAESEEGATGAAGRLLGQAGEQAAPLLQPTEATEAVGTLVGEVRERTQLVGRVIKVLVATFSQAPALLDWIEDQVRDPDSRAQWQSIFIGIGILIAVSLSAFTATRTALRGLRRRLGTDVPADWAGKLPRVLGQLGLELVALVAFTVSAYLTVAILPLSPVVELIAIALVQAGVVVRGLNALAVTVLSPQEPSLRLVPVNDGDAQMTVSWIWWLGIFLIYGNAVLYAAEALGLPWELAGALKQLQGVIIAVHVIRLIVRLRTPVAGFIDHFGGRTGVLQGLWRIISRFWHLLAVLYVFFVFAVYSLDVAGGFRALFLATLGSIAVLVIAYGMLWWVEKHLNPASAAEPRPSALSDDTADDAAETTASSSFRASLARFVVLALTVLAIAEIWGLGLMPWLFSEAGREFSESLIDLGVTLGAFIGVWYLIDAAIARSLNVAEDAPNAPSSRGRTLMVISRNVLRVIMTVVVALITFSTLGVNIAPLLAGAGVLGLAIGFGSQRLVQDIITGVFILIEDTVSVGDVVELFGKAGVVEALTIRTVRLRDYYGNVHTIPFSSIDSITNMTKLFSYAVFDIGVAYKEKVDRVIETLEALGTGMRREPVWRRQILAPLEMAGVERLADSSVVVRCRFRTRAGSQWAVSREFNRRVKNRFDELGIEIPFPHQTVYFRSNNDEHAAAPPPLLRPDAPAQPAEPASNVMTAPVLTPVRS